MLPNRGKRHIHENLSTSLTKWSNTLEQFVGSCRQIGLMCLTILWGWYLKKVNTPTANVPINLKPPSDLVYKLIDWR